MVDGIRSSRLAPGWQPVEPGAAKSTAVGGVRAESQVDAVNKAVPAASLRAPSAAITVDFGRLLPALGYGSSAVLATLAERLEKEPDGALAAALLEGEGSAKVPHSQARPAGKNPAHQVFADSRRYADSVECEAVVAALLLRWLSGVTSPAGSIDPAAVRAALGPDAAVVLGWLETSGTQPLPRIHHDRFMGLVLETLGQTMKRPAALALADRLVRNDALIPRRLPAVDRALQEIPDGRFAGEGLVAKQHFFPTLVPLLEALVKKGMRPADIHVLNTGYFEAKLVTAYLRLAGMHAEARNHGESRSQRDAVFAALDLNGFLGRIAQAMPHPPKGWVILDDGGLTHATVAGRLLPLIPESVHDYALPFQQAIAEAFTPDRVRGVEQTTRGLTEQRKNPPRYQVVAVAEAPAKREEESPLIGWSIADALARQLAQTPGGRAVRKIVVLGAGNVGLSSARQLAAAGFEVALVDIRPETREAARRAVAGSSISVHATLAEARAGAQLILGATGVRAIELDDLEGFRGYVASASSRTVELDPLAIHERFGNAIHVLNDGRPLNFTPDSHENLAPQQIALTRALLLLGMAQENGPAGVTPLALGPQQRVVEYWRATGGHLVPAVQRARPPLPAPDTLPDNPSPSQREWEVFLQNHALPWGGHSFSGWYFETPSGEVRWVSKSGGPSWPTPLPAVPDMDWASSAHSWHQVIVGENGSSRIYTMRPTPEGLRSDGGVPVDRYYGWARGGTGTAVVAGHAGELLIFDGNGGAPHRAPVPELAASVVAWPHIDDPVLVFQRRPARVTVVPSHAGQDVSAWADFRLPPEMVEVTNVRRVLYGRQNVIVGKDAAGCVLLVAVDPSLESPLLRLPPGAKLRELSLPAMEQYDRKLSVEVEYVPPGGVDDPDRYQRVTLKLAAHAAD